MEVSQHRPEQVLWCGQHAKGLAAIGARRDTSLRSALNKYQGGPSLAPYEALFHASGRFVQSLYAGWIPDIFLREREYIRKETTLVVESNSLGRGAMLHRPTQGKKIKVLEGISIGKSAYPTRRASPPYFYGFSAKQGSFL